jgi:hypothetical protein
LRIPGWLAENALPPLLAALNLRNQGELAHRLVNRVSFGPQQLVLAYALPNGLRHDLRESLLPAAEQARLKAYADHLATVSGLLAARQSKVSMAQLIPPTFQFAARRSTDRASAEAENRAALVALAFLVNHQNLATLAPGATPWPRKPELHVELAQRSDTPLHFLVSSALAVTGGGPLADAIGLYKEVADSKGGSGFSFNDLAADRAGTRFGQQALRDPQGFQSRLAAIRLEESDLLPPIADLPEAMSADEFARRYGGVGAPAYQRMLADIEARLDKLVLLRPPR